MSHLTDDQIDDLLIADAADEVVAHLGSCTHCASRLAAAQEPMASFNAASLAWGERRSATLSLQLQQKPAGLLQAGRLRLAVGAAAAAVFTLALALPLLHRAAATETARQAAPPSSSPQTIQTAAVLPPASPLATGPDQPQTPEQEQIARDNQLLQAIDRELANSETPADLLKMVGQQDGNQISPDRTHND